MKKLIASVAVMAPAIALAQTTITSAESLATRLTQLGNLFIQILIALAVIWIIYNVIRFIIKSDNPEERSTIGKAILWGIVGLFVILSIWGLVRILTNTFRTANNAPTQSSGEVPSVYLR